MNVDDEQAPAKMKTDDAPAVSVVRDAGAVDVNTPSDGDRSSTVEMRECRRLTHLSVVLAVLVRCASAVALALVITWIVQCQGGLGFATDASNTFGWHALLFVIAFPVLMTELVLCFRTPSPSDALTRNVRARQRCAFAWHLTLVVGVVVLSCLAIVAIVNFKKDAIAASAMPDMAMYPNYTLASTHSWMGVTTLALLLIQLGLGVGKSFLRRGTALRGALGSVHAFVGKATWVAGLATCASGVGGMQGSDLAEAMEGDGYGPYSVSSLLAPSLAIVLMFQALLVFAALALADSYGRHRGMGRESGSADR